jgi:hypothetical protein
MTFLDWLNYLLLDLIYTRIVSFNPALQEKGGK